MEEAGDQQRIRTMDDDMRRKFDHYIAQLRHKGNYSLASDVERCFRKVTEGVQEFDESWERLRHAQTANQKCKHENDLKKVIKKLQRFREQLKTWITSVEIKEKQTLMDTRKIIEKQMEKFKILEREAKKKAYSRKGLGAPAKMDPLTRDRDELTNWFILSIDNLRMQLDHFECEIEALSAPQKKRTTENRIEELRTFSEKHAFHTDKLETLMRILHNLSFEVESDGIAMSKFIEKVKGIKEDVDYYILSNQEPDFNEDLLIYDDFDFNEEFMRTANLESPISAEGEEDEAKSGEDSNTNNNENSSDDNADQPESAGTSDEATPDTPELLGACALPPPPPPMAELTTDSRRMPLTGEGGSELTFPPITPLDSNAKDTNNETPSTNEGSDNVSGETPGCQQFGYNQSKVFAPLSNAGTFTSPAQAQPKLGAANALEPKTQFGRDFFKMPSNTAKDSDRFGVNSAIPNARAADNVTQGSSNDPFESQRDGLNNARQGQFANSLMQDPRLFPFPPQQDGLQVGYIPPSLGVAPLGPVLFTPQQLTQQSMLSAASKHMPLSADSTRVRHWLPREPCVTPSYYPQRPLPHANTIAFYEKCSVETLFFVFYHNEGTLAQYLAAKLLKRHNWRYHVRYKLWFQRLEEPRHINSEFEQGSYICFDIQQWRMRKMEGFIFEYKYLEDKVPV